MFKTLPTKTKLQEFQSDKGNWEHSKETSSQLELVRNSYVTIMHQPVAVSSFTCSQIYVQ